jgi:hypothetical protein
VAIVLNQPLAAYSICPSCGRKFDYNESECKGCAVAKIPGAHKFPTLLWKCVPQIDGSILKLPPGWLAPTPEKLGGRWRRAVKED